MALPVARVQTNREGSSFWKRGLIFGISHVHHLPHATLPAPSCCLGQAVALIPSPVVREAMHLCCTTPMSARSNTLTRSTNQLKLQCLHHMRNKHRKFPQILSLVFSKKPLRKPRKKPPKEVWRWYHHPSFSSLFLLPFAFCHLIRAGRSPRPPPRQHRGH